MSWSPDGRTLAVPRGKEVAFIEVPWTTVSDAIVRPRTVKAVTWSPDGKGVMTWEEDGSLHLLDPADPAKVLDLPGPKSVVPPSWSPDGTELAFGTDDNTVMVWDRRQNKITYTLSGHQRKLHAVAFLGDGKTLVSASAGAVRFWDLEHGRLRGTLLNLNGVKTLAISPEGNYRHSPGLEADFQFKVLESKEFRDFYPDTFRQTYGWTNNPDRVKLTGD
jgi:WD40 repeat protein